MRAFLVVDIWTRKLQIVDRASAASLAQLDTDELEYVLDEEGACETNRYTIVDIIVKGESYRIS